MEARSDSNGNALLAIRGTNTYSFRGDFELSMLATRLAQPHVVRELPWRAGGKPVRVLPVAGIFGPNASGKSNLLHAIDCAAASIRGSFRRDPTSPMHRHPFMLDEDSSRRSSRFEVDLVLDGVRCEYGFEIDDERVIAEWAHRYPKGKAMLLFSRRGDRVEHGPAIRSQGRTVERLLRPDALFLSTAAQANHTGLLPLYRWFAENLWLAGSWNRSTRQFVTAELLDREETREELLRLVRAADLGIADVRAREMNSKEADEFRRRYRPANQDEHQRSDRPAEPLPKVLEVVHAGQGRPIPFDLGLESMGTRVWLGLVGPAMQALAEGTVLLLDEIDASLHPDLVEQLVRLFQEPSSNPRGAQIIFNSHAVSLLSGAGDDRLLGRDQIWFTEKGSDGSSRLYPLVELDPRKEESIAHRYREGRYGAVPILSRAEFEEAAELIHRPGTAG
jgi:uncharacterized protein